jgi:hypothetical protein
MRTGDGHPFYTLFSNCSLACLYVKSLMSHIQVDAVAAVDRDGFKFHEPFMRLRRATYLSMVRSNAPRLCSWKLFRPSQKRDRQSS